MKLLILLLLIVLLWNISNAEECDCGTFIEPKPKDRKTRQIAQERTPQNTRIFKGSDANADRYPWQIFLKIVATQDQASEVCVQDPSQSTELLFKKIPNFTINEKFLENFIFLFLPKITLIVFFFIIEMVHY